MKILCPLSTGKGKNFRCFSRRISHLWLLMACSMLITNSINAQLNIQGEVVTDCTCPADSDGFIDLAVAGGTAPYTYLWTFNNAEVVCSPRVDFSPLDGIGCTPASAGGECSPDQNCTAPSDAINAQNYLIGDAVLTVSPAMPMGGACIDENAINDSTLDDFFSIRTGVSMLGNQGPAANVTRIWTFNNPVCNLEILLNDIDGEDAVIVNAKSNGVIVPLTDSDFILTNSTPDTPCPVYTGNNTWESQNNCSSADNTDRGGILINFPVCIDEIEFIYYDYSGGGSAGGSYAVGFSTLCSSNLQCVESGTYQVQVTDVNGLTGSAEFVVPDVTASTPTITCPNDISVVLDAGTCDAVINWPDPVTDDICPNNLTVTSTHQSGDTFTAGTTTVTYTVTNADGNSATCSFDVTVQDTESPVVTTCPDNITVTLSQGTCETAVSWNVPTSTDNCEVGTVTSNFSSGDTFTGGTTTVTYSILDAAGNEVTCSFDVIVEDIESPVLTTCPDDITVTLPQGVCDVPVTWTVPTSTDNCEVGNVTSNFNSGDTFAAGTTTINYSIVDLAGNEVTCIFDVIVVDTESPVVTTCPDDITVDLPAGTCEIPVTWTVPTSTDNCEVGNVTSNFSSGDNFPGGTTTVIYTIVDLAGNEVECTFDVIVNDNEAPVVTTCPDDIMVDLEVGSCGAVVNWTVPTSTDNCEVGNVTSNFNSGDTFSQGTTTVVYTITDLAGNNVDCTFDVVVGDNEAPIITNCPDSVVVALLPGTCEIPVTWTVPTSTDNCQLGNVTSNFNSGDTFTSGTTNVVYTFEDDAGNQIECAFDVIVQDNEAPVVTTCPDDITVDLPQGTCEIAVDWTVPTSTDNCEVGNVTSNFSSGDMFPGGTTTVVYSILDAAGNEVECTFDVIVNDNEAPVVTTCPDSIIVDLPLGTCEIAVDWTVPTSTDNCEVGSVTSNFSSGDTFTGGTTTVVYSILDAAGNEVECTFDVIVQDNEAPVVTTCPDDITVDLPQGTCEIAVDWTVPTSTDNCEVGSVTSNFSSGDTFTGGTTTVVYSILDAAGNEVQCTFDVIVNDNEAPVVTTCPDDITAVLPQGTCEVPVTWTVPTSTDNCEVGNVTSNFSSGDNFPGGTTTVVYTIVDAAGNEVECTFDVIVQDNEAPVVTTCPSDITVDLPLGTCEIAVDWTVPTSTDNCEVGNVTSNFSSGDNFPGGTTTVVYTIVDLAGNEVECTFDVIVNDNEAPVVTTCPDDIMVDLEEGSCATVVNWTVPTSTDNCEVGNVTSNFSSGDTFSQGTTTVVYTIADAAGNEVQCTFDVTVGDNEAPVIANCPDDITVALPQGTCEIAVDWTVPTSTDNCVLGNVTSNFNSGDTFTGGTTNVVYTFEDVAGNQIECAFNVIVQDNEAPVVTTCPDNITVDLPEGTCEIAVDWTVPTSTDNCEVGSVTGNFSSGDMFPGGTTTVVYSILDAAGNEVQCTFDVIVNDNEAPVVTTCPDNITVDLPQGTCEIAVDWTVPTSTDNCEVGSVTSNFSSGDTFTGGTTTVVYSILDAAGNEVQCTFDVIVQDNEAPVVTTCPDNITVDLPQGTCDITVDWTVPTSTDNCEVGSVTSNFSSGDTFTGGTTTVVYSILDAAGNEVQCTFDVIVNDNEAPVVTTCPDDITVNLPQGTCDITVDWTVPTSTDNCEVGSVTSNYSSGDTFTGGITPVVYTITDAAGNEVECSFNVIVQDNEAPVVTTCPDDITVTLPQGSCEITVDWTVPTSTDNCEVGSVTSNFSSGDTFTGGTTTVVYTIEDAAGNQVECTFDVIVQDNEAPVITTCPNDITVALPQGSCEIAVDWTVPTSTDNCEVGSVTSNYSSGDTFIGGVTTVVYTVLDAAGNQVQCTFNVIVEDNEAPVVTNCPDDITVALPQGSCEIAIDWTVPTSTDNCEVGSITSNFSSGDTFTGGTTTVVYSIIDAAGNEVECSFDVIVQDNEFPVVTDCPSDIMVDLPVGTCEIAVDWTVPTSTDNCEVGSVSSNFSSGDTFTGGTTTVVYSIIDAAGNQVECTFDVIVNDNESPVITDCPGDITVDLPAGTCEIAVDWTVPSSTDNCEVGNVFSNYNSGDNFPGGTTTVTYSFVDAAGNLSECIFDVIVNDNEAPVITTCPDDISVTIESGCEATVNWTVPTATDNCEVGSVVGNFNSGDTFPVGTTTVVYNILDAAGNPVTCSFDVTVEDMDSPVVTDCPDDITVTLEEGSCDITIDWTVPTYTDNCEIGSVSSNFNSGDTFPAGTTTVVYTILDAAGNEVTCSFDVNVLECLSETSTENIQLEENSGLFIGLNPTAGFEGNPSYTFTTPTIVGNQTISNITLELFFTIFGNSCESNIAVKITDSSGNIHSFNNIFATCDGTEQPFYTTTLNIPADGEYVGGDWLVQFNDLFIDNPNQFEYSVGIARFSYNLNTTTSGCADPIIVNCPADITQTVNAGVCTTQVNIPEPTFGEDFTDCFGATITNNYTGTSDGSGLYPVGVSVITWTVTDDQGNTATCEQTITIEDNEPSVITCPDNITTSVQAGNCTATATWDFPTPNDNCGISSVSSDYNPGDTFPVGTTTVTYTIVDANDNVTTCSFDVTIEDIEIPVVVNCPSDVTVPNDPNDCSAVVEWESLVISDNCEVSTVASNYSSGDSFEVGTTTVTYTVTDPSGNVVECSFDITVIDTEDQELTCQENIDNIFTDPGQCSAVVQFSLPGISDNCGAMITSSSHNAGDTFPVGTTTVTYTAEDIAGNVVSCSFDITVTDKEAPEITCPSSVTVSVDPGQCDAAVTWDPPVSFTDNCGATLSGSHNPGDTFPVGQTFVTYTATDAAGNIAECSFTVTVIDNQPPVAVNCPADITVSTDAGVCNASVSWIEPTVEDDCEAFIIGSSHQPGALFPLGTTEVIYGILDASGNASSCRFTVTVEDAEVPTMECPEDITVFNDVGLCSAAVEWAIPIPIDNCEASIISSSHTPGDVFPIGTTTVSYTAEDPNGFTTSCSFDITVVDKEVPVLVCPGNIVVNNTPGECTAIVNWVPPTITDNCGTAQITSDYSPGDVFPVGTTAVTYTITDDAGNVSNCTFTVKVNDNEDPIVANCPADITVSTDPGVCNASVSWIEPTALDNCEAFIVGASHTPGALFPLGTTQVIYGILDASGNAISCRFTVTVEDTEGPRMDCPADITVFNDDNTCEAVVNWTIPEPIDNCEASIISSSHTPGDVFPIGTTTVTYTAEDPNGFQTTCSFDVIVVDKEVPVITCPGDVMATTDAGQCSAVVTWDPLPIEDNCGTSDITITSDYSSGDVFPVGYTIVTYLITDEQGNTANCSFNVIVTDTEIPTVNNCPADITVPNDPGVCNAVVDWSVPTISDNCGASIVGSTHSPGAIFPIGTTQVVYGILDNSGNAISCVFNVTVVGGEGPTLVCPADITVSNDAGQCGASVTWAPPIPIDNCGATITNNSHNPGDFFPVGTTSVSYTATDDDGFEVTCTFDVTVEDVEDPVITCPADITVPFDTGGCNAVVNWNAVLTDNCNATITSNTHNSGDTFEFGTTTVTYTAEDENGNTTICSFDVTVEDNEPPVINNCPDDVTVAGPPGECEGPVIIPTPQFGTDYTDCQGSTTFLNDFNGTANASDIYPVGTTVVTWTATDPAGNEVTCQQTIIVTPTDFNDDVALVTDQDVFIGAVDGAGFEDHDSIIIVAPGVPDNAVIGTVILDFFFRVEGQSCEKDAEVRVTDPGGARTIFPAPLTTCNRNDAIFQFLLPSAAISTAGGNWILEFRDTDDQNPGAVEYSVRFGRITYELTITPDCDGDGGGEGIVTELPVELTHFKGTEEDCEVMLSWATASEINVSHFEIQKSNDGVIFNTIDRMDALGGEGILAEYTYADPQIVATNYYRLRIVDMDGQVEYSDIFTIQADCAAGVSISDVFPNPSVNQMISVQFNSNVDHEDAVVVIRDMLGRKMMEVPTPVYLGANMITVDPTRLPAATYFMVIEGSGWRSSAAKFVILN